MQAFVGNMATLLVSMLFAELATCSAGEHVGRHNRATHQAPLQAATAGLRGPSDQQAAPDDWSVRLEGALSAGLMPQPLALAASPSKGGETTSSRVSMQLAQEELAALTSKLSVSCKDRFSALLEGKSPSLHTFQSGGNATEESCRSLNGGLCKTQAHIHDKAKDMGTGRKMRKAIDVMGQGCLPKECLTTSDLQPLANFLRGKAQSTMPGMSAEVALHVDCTASGGGVASVGDIVTSSKPTLMHSAAIGVASVPLAATVLAYSVMSFSM